MNSLATFRRRACSARSPTRVSQATWRKRLCILQVPGESRCSTSAVFERHVRDDRSQVFPAAGRFGAAGARPARGATWQSRSQTAPRKSVIFVFLWGAEPPRHVRSEAGRPVEYRGPFSPIATKTPGLHFTELLPGIAAQRSVLDHSHARHDRTGPSRRRDSRAHRFQGSPRPRSAELRLDRRQASGQPRQPAAVRVAGRGVVMDGDRRVEGYGGGKLSSAFDPMLVGCSGDGEIDIPALRLLEGLNPLRIRDRPNLEQYATETSSGGRT